MKDATTGWYLIHTKHNQEQIAKVNLCNQGFYCYLPLLQQHKRRNNMYKIVTEPLFPKYLFIQLTTFVDDWSKIRSTRGCINLVRFGTQLAKVPNQLIKTLQLTEEQRCIKESIRTPDFKLGDRVEIISGILSGYEGIIQSKNSQQRITLLLLMAEEYSRKVDLSVHQVRIAC